MAWKASNPNYRETVEMPSKGASRTGRLEWQPGIFTLLMKEETELLVIGDLHGCYNNLIAMLEQSCFCEKLDQGEDVYLVLLGDYFDRGRHAVDGILPTLLDLIRRYPGRIAPLQGNHELLKSQDPGYIACSNPSETWSFWMPYLGPQGMKSLYALFNRMMPLAVYCSNGIFLSHAGIPDDDFISGFQGWGDFEQASKNRASNPTALNLLWTDPGKMQSLPSSSINPFHRPFGTLQFDAFMEKIGGRLMIRGHEEKPDGVEFTYPDRLITLFSAGGEGNPHAEGSYRNVVPRYLRIRGNRIQACRILWDRVEGR